MQATLVVRRVNHEGAPLRPQVVAARGLVGAPSVGAAEPPDPIRHTGARSFAAARLLAAPPAAVLGDGPGGHAPVAWCPWSTSTGSTARSCGDLSW